MFESQLSLKNWLIIRRINSITSMIIIILLVPLKLLIESDVLALDTLSPSKALYVILNSQHAFVSSPPL